MLKKQELIVVIGACCPDLALWQFVLDEAVQAGLSVIQAELSEKGEAFHFQIELRGSWHQSAKLEIALKHIEAQSAEQGSLHWMRRSFENTLSNYLPYQVEVVSLVKADLILVFSQFFNVKGVKIKNMRTQTYLQPTTQVPLQLTRLTVWIPLDLNLSELRENFMILCDEYNLDSIFDPERI
jgi:glycine cleavage system transcriptional repressor